MANPTHPQNAAQKNAEHYFKSAEQQPDTAGKQLRKKERAVAATNTARLRELRLAKETADKEAAGISGAESTTAEPASRRKRAPKVKSILRMRY